MNLNFSSGLNAFLGYGHVGINLAKSLSNSGINISLFPIGGVQLATNDHNLIQSLINKQDTCGYNDPCLTAWHEHDLIARKIGNGKYYTLSFFELDTLNERRKHHLNYSDSIITPSSWAKNVMLNNGITAEIHTIPMGVDNSIFYPIERPENKNYVFFVFGKWEVRKSHFELKNIFNKAFTKNDNVELWMICHNPFLSQEETKEWEDYYKNSPLGDKIKIINPVATDVELAQTINNTDCGISLSKSEGWDLPLTQLLAMNKPIIASNHSAHKEYCNSENSYLVEIDELEESYDGKWFGFGTSNIGRWAKIGPAQESQAIEHMRYVYKNNIRHNPEGVKTAQSLTWTNTATKIKNLIFPQTKSQKENPNA